MGFTHWEWDEQLQNGNGISFLQRSLLIYFEIEKIKFRSNRPCTPQQIL